PSRPPFPIPSQTSIEAADEERPTQNSFARTQSTLPRQDQIADQLLCLLGCAKRIERRPLWDKTRKSRKRLSQSIRSRRQLINKHCERVLPIQNLVACSLLDVRH